MKEVKCCSERVEPDYEAGCDYWRGRALKAEAKVRELGKDAQTLEKVAVNQTTQFLLDSIGGERDRAIKAEKAVRRLIAVLLERDILPPEPYCETPPQGVDCELGYDCRKCWRMWLKQEGK